MSKVAIIGSCITRDVWPIIGKAPADLLYISRTSLPSLFASSLPGASNLDETVADLPRHPNNALHDDLKKRVLGQLVAHRPTHIIFDFIDERFDLVAVGNSLVTHSWELDVSGYLAKPPFAGARQAPRDSRACDLLWREAAAEMAAFIQATPLRDATLILHGAQWATHYRDPHGDLRDFDPEIPLLESNRGSIPSHNAILDRYQDIFRRAVPGIREVACPELRIGDSGHRWGLSPFHFITDYYVEIGRQLRGLGV